MNRKKYIALTLMLSLLGINNVYADCTEELEQEYIDIKSQYKITTTFNSKEKKYTARIETAKTDKFRYATAITTQYECNEVSDTVTECYGIEPGKIFYAYVIGNTKDCDTIFSEETFKLKKYNKYYGDPLCTGIEEFVLCQELYDRDIDRETFEYRINSYKEKKQQINEEQLKEQEKKTENKVVSYIKEHTIEVIIVSVFIILLTVTSIIGYNKIMKSRRLE